MDCPCNKPKKEMCPMPDVVERPVLLRAVTLPPSVGTEDDYPPTVGLYRNVILKYAANNHVYIYSSDGIPVLLESEVPQSVWDELERLQQEIDDMKNSPDVVDIVDTHADLENYDTSSLGDNDIIRVLQDETHDGDSSFYRWDATNSSWVYIGSTPPAQKTFYADSAETGGTRHIYANSDMTGAVSAQTVFDASTKGLVILRMSTAYSPTSYNDTYLVNAYVDTSNNDFQLIFSDGIWTYGYDTNNLANTVFDFSKSQYQQKLTAGANITITGNSISATDTTYSNFVGTDGVVPGSAGLVPAPATTDAGKVLGADGTWVQGGPTVVQATGTSTTDVMSQNAVTSMVYDDPGTKKNVVIGGGTIGSAKDPVVIGRAASVRGNYAIAIGSAAGSQVTNAPGAISLGAFSEAGVQGQMDISLASATSQAKAANGYAGSGYRLLTGLYDPQNAHDAATKGYVDTAVVNGGTMAPTTATVGVVGALYSCVNSGTPEIYMCTAVSGTVYTWAKVI